MATTTTHFVNCPAGDWTLLADGSATASVGVQSDGAMAIAVASSKPSADSGDYIRAQPPTATLVVLPLGTGDKLYGKPVGVNAGGVRFYKVSVS